MRRYHAREVTEAEGILQIQGTWDAVSKLALFFGLVVLPAASAQPLALLLAIPIGVCMFMLPPRRVVRIDKAARELRITHTGVFREREDRTVAFEDLRQVTLVEAGHRNGYTRWELVVDLEDDRLPLVSLWDDYEVGKLRRAIGGLWPDDPAGRDGR
jgi:hypothetical protein